MSKKDEFKLFASKHPELVKYIKSGEMTWQSFYEIYDIYGESDNAWDSYLKKETTKNVNNSATPSFKAITDKLKNIDMDSIQHHINTAQKALGIVQELTTKGGTGAGIASAAEAVNPRPINKIFED